MPALGMQQDTGTLIAWLARDGQLVAKGDPIMEIETDKVVVEIEAPASGRLGGICAGQGDVIPVGQTVAWILEPGEAAPGETRHEPPGRPAALKGAGTIADEQAGDPGPERSAGGEIHGTGASEPGPRGGGARLFPASPKARRLARERGLDIKDVAGAGPGGAVLAGDVLAARAQTPSPGVIQAVEADRPAHGGTHIPANCLFREVNAGRLWVWRRQMQGYTEPPPTTSDLLVKIVAAALGLHKHVNASWTGAKVVLNSEINIGLAMKSGEGWVVPVIHRADELELAQVAVRRQDLVSRARAGTLSEADFSGGSFAIGSQGLHGVDASTAAVEPPQASILTVGRIAERVVPVDGEPAEEPMMTLGLAFDPRVMDGARAEQFLETLDRLVEEPFLLLA